MRSRVAMRKSIALSLFAALGLLTVSLSACSKRAADGEVDRLVLGFYTTPREVYGRAILPAFIERHERFTGRRLEIHDSYLGSGAQARAIVGGFEADVAALSLKPDLDHLAEANLITHDYAEGQYGGMVTRSLVVIGVREGNPKHIRDFADLARPGVSILTPNVRMSGGAMWNFLALYGAAKRGHLGVDPSDEDAIIRRLSEILRNVIVMDRGARESSLNFERGIGDAIITYENELLTARDAGHRFEIIIPRSTILIENPIALVDVYAKKHGSLEIARSFIEFVHTQEAQRAFAEAGYRPVHPAVEEEFRSKFPAVDELFRVEDLGGWETVRREIFAAGALYDRVLEASRRR